MRSIAVVLAAIAACAQFAGLPAQIGLGHSMAKRAFEEGIREQERLELEQRRLQEQRMFPSSALPKHAPLPFHLGYSPGLQSLFPRYEGLPTYPNNVPGYGGYPGAAKDPDRAGSPALVPGLRRDAPSDAWPSWIEPGTDKSSMQASAQQSVLVRVVDRVWLRSPGEDAFVPLAFYDRFRFMQTGSEVEVRGKGEYQVVMHDGAGLRSRGPSSVTVVSMNDAALVLQVGAVEQMWITGKIRPVQVRLPDGSVVEYTDSLLHLERRGDRIRVANEGSKPIRFSGTAGDGQIEGPRFISVWTAPPARPQFGDALQVLGGVTRATAGAATTLGGAVDGQVIWSGARFAVGPGTSLRVEPLQPIQPGR